MKQPQNWITGLVLFAATLALYWPVTSYPFVDYDDNLYIYQNPEVQKGLTGEGIRYAFTTVVAANWHPLTILAHMADCSMFGPQAGWHHFINALFHALDTVLLWILFKRLTGLFWPGILVAALFGWHPLNVESVAWISELKNGLSTFFFLLTLLAYLHYVKKPGPKTYLLSLGLYALGLLAKPMLVTLPFLLLLLDYWPLKRIFPAPVSASRGKKGKPAMETKIKPVKFLVLEKVPFLVLAAADSVITYLAQTWQGSIVSFAAVPMNVRLLNIPVAYVTYLMKIFWPSHLCILYSFPDKMSPVPAAVCLLCLVVGTLVVWRAAGQFRWLVVGWLWFLVTLVPVIGVVQTGAQAWADRHAYVPAIGIFLIIACGANELWKARAAWRAFIVLGCGLFLCACVALSWQQINDWRNGVALFSRAVAINPINTQAQDLLGIAYNDVGDFADAVAHFAVAARLHPGTPEYQYDLGRALMDDQRFADAEEPLAAAVQLKPNDDTWRNTLGAAYVMAGQPQAAENIFLQAIAQQPQFAISYYNLGIVQMKEQKAPAAVTNFLMAVKLQSDWPEALQRLAAAYATTRDFSNAVASASVALTAAEAKKNSDLAGQISAQLNSYQASLQPQH
jgi:Flp pilus assembly protein TadD